MELWSWAVAAMLSTHPHPDDTVPPPRPTVAAADPIWAPAHPCPCPDRSRRPMRVAGWTMAGVSLSATVAAATLGGLTLREKRRFEADQSDPSVPPSAGVAERFYTYRTTTNALVGVAVATAASAATLLIVDAVQHRR